MHVFKLDFGDFDTDDYNNLQVALFIIAAIFIPLIMLNMLIAIMSDTYDRVKEDQSKRDYHELAGLLFEY